MGIEYGNVFDSLLSETVRLCNKFIEMNMADVHYSGYNEELKRAIKLCNKFLDLVEKYSELVMDVNSTWDEIANMEKRLWDEIFKVLKELNKW